MRQDIGRLGGRGGHEEAALAEARRRTVVEDDAVVPQHDAVARAPDWQAGEPVGIDPVEEGDRVRTLDIDLAQRRDVHQACRVARIAHLGDIGLVHVRPGGTIEPRPHPGARLEHLGAVRDVPVVHRRAADRPEMAAGGAPGQGADGDGRVGRAEGRRADVGDGGLAQDSHGRECGKVAGLALIRAHAERGVALQVLDRLVALAMRECYVAGGDVHLKVDKRFAATRDGRRPEDLRHGLAEIEPRNRRRRPRLVAERRCLGSGAMTLLDRGARRVASHHRAGPELARRERARNEAVDVVPIDRLGAQVRGEMHGWRPAARTGRRDRMRRPCSRLARRVSRASPHGRRADPRCACRFEPGRRGRPLPRGDRPPPRRADPRPSPQHPPRQGRRPYDRRRRSPWRRPPFFPAERRNRLR